jgi:hypothetical protein
VYWQSYGRAAPGMEVSGLEEELDLSRGLSRLLYIKGPAPDREPRLTEMLGRVRAEAADSYRYFTTARELGRLVRDDLATLLSERFAAAGREGAAESPAPRPRPRASCPSAARHWSGVSEPSTRSPGCSGAQAGAW